MRHSLILTGAALMLGACVTSEDPADGGFFNGVSGATSGTYDARVEDREQAVAAAQTRNAALSREQQALAAQIKGAESELARLKFKILQQKSAIGRIDGPTNARVNAVLNASPSGATPDAKLAALQKTIANARALSADLEKLAG